MLLVIIWKFKLKTIHYLFTLSFFIFNTYAHSAQSVKNEHNTNSDDEAALLMLLQEETEIATKTRLNADFVPGMVTVLHGDELLQQGVLNVWQALGRVPGMEAALDKIGSRIVKVRGIGGSFASGNLKIMLNNVAMNSTLSALSQPVMNMPIEQIERIEVMRGPGSAIHGEFAYAGVVNVITHTQKKMVFAGIAEHNSFLAGGVWNWSNLAGIYLLDELSETAIHAIIRQATKYQIITYSPFKGDVERGVLGGLSVEAKVRPYINMGVDLLKRRNYRINSTIKA